MPCLNCRPQASHNRSNPRKSVACTLLDGAIDRPRNKRGYEPQSTTFELAAALGVGLARNPAFVDGNNRTALLAARAFLYLNGRVLELAENDEVFTMVGVATGAVREAKLPVWLEMNSQMQKTTSVSKQIQAVCEALTNQRWDSVANDRASAPRL